MMRITAPKYSEHKGKKEKGEVKGEYGGVYGEEERNADYGGMIEPSQQRVAPCVKEVAWGFCTRDLRMLAAFWAGIPVDNTQDAGVVPCL